MLSSNSRPTIPASKCAPYVCVQCRFRARFHPANTFQSHLSQDKHSQSRSTRSLPRVKSSNRSRHFGSRPSLLVADQTSTFTPSDNVPTDWPIRKHYGKIINQRGKLEPSFIRDQLRAWSISNEESKTENAQTEIASTDRVIAPPNNLFLEEAENEEHENEEKIELDEYDDLLEGGNRLQLEPGDLMHLESLRVGGQFAVFLGMKSFYYQFFLSDGRWILSNPTRRFTLAVSNFASEHEIQDILDHCPKGDIQAENRGFNTMSSAAIIRDLPAPVSKPLRLKISKLKEDITAFRRDYIEILDSMYDKLAHETEYRNFSIEGLVYKLFNLDFEELSAGAKMAIYRAIETDSLRLQPTDVRSGIMSIIFTPKNIVRQIDQVFTWARQYQDLAAKATLGQDVTALLSQNPLKHFIEKARRLILKSRSIRSPTTIGIIGPSANQKFSRDSVAIEETGEVYSETDKMILEFLWNTFLRIPKMRTMSASHSIGSLILRAIGAYPKLQLSATAGRLLLQEIGSIAPWAEATDENVVFPLPGRRGAHEADRLYQVSEALSEELGFDRKSQQIPLVDTMAHMRRDLGDMEVFCVDSPSTVLIDDGYSIEPSEEDSQCHWIHCHVAHPSAYIDPDHVFAQRARHFGSSLYTSKQTYPMMPWEVGTSLSLAPGASALTISTLVHETGEVKDIKIFPSIVRNFIKLEPNALKQVMGMPQSEKAYLVVGNDPSFTSTTSDSPTKEALAKVSQYLPTLQKMEKLLLARVNARKREVPLAAEIPVFENNQIATVNFLEPYNSTRLLRSYHYHGDPTIKCVADRFQWKGSSATRHVKEDLTALVSMLTSESAGKWFKERQIPAVFQGTLTLPEFPLSKLNQTKPHEQFLLPAAKTSSVPIPHVLYNIQQYIRVGSPLRRYPDLLAHWQIDAYLKAEAAGHVVAGAPASTILLPYNQGSVEKYIQSQSFVITEAKRLARRSSEHWILQAFFRAFHFHEAELPAVWDFRVDLKGQSRSTLPEDTGIRGRLMPFGLSAVLLKSPEGWEDQAQYASYFPVKIDIVDLGHSCVYVRAVGSLKDQETCTDPIRIGLKD